MEEAINLCLGFFDGVHLGHQYLIKKAQNEGYKTGILTFDSSPNYVLGKINDVHQLTSISDKYEYFSELGVDYLFLMHFDSAVSRLSKEDFVNLVLKKLNPHRLFCGEDYRFGYQGSGDGNYLKNYFDIDILKFYEIDGEKVSSRSIIYLLKDGNVKKAKELLSRYYRVDGLVVEGLKNGRKIDVPTANLKLNYPYIYPKIGVYAGYATIDDEKYNAIISVGTHPTINPLESPIIEIHILDFDQNLYGKNIFVEFEEFLRDEKRIDSLEDLKAQIKIDEEKAKKLLR